MKRTVHASKVRSRHIPRAVVREVFARDGAQCRYVSADGKRCESREFLEKHHHDVPFARGGESTVENVRLMCRGHNALLAEQDYGPDFIRAKKHRDTENDSSSLAAHLQPTAAPGSASVRRRGQFALDGAQLVSGDANSCQPSARLKS